jgi:hypothetical protein
MIGIEMFVDVSEIHKLTRLALAVGRRLRSLARAMEKSAGVKGSIRQQPFPTPQRLAKMPI